MTGRFVGERRRVRRRNLEERCFEGKRLATRWRRELGGRTGHPQRSVASLRPSFCRFRFKRNESESGKNGGRDAASSFFPFVRQMLSFAYFFLSSVFVRPSSGGVRCLRRGTREKAKSTHLRFAKTQSEKARSNRATTQEHTQQEQTHRMTQANNGSSRPTFAVKVRRRFPPH
jgi:hypothetical protein